MAQNYSLNYFSALLIITCYTCIACLQVGHHVPGAGLLMMEIVVWERDEAAGSAWATVIDKR